MCIRDRPTTTPNQKISKTQIFGGNNIKIKMKGDYFDDCLFSAKSYSKEKGAYFLSPFDDKDVIEGQGTVAVEIEEQLGFAPDKIIMPVGGGGLLCEALYDFGGIITGIDAAGPGIEVAKIHAKENDKNISYYEKTAEILNQECSEAYDIVTCLEVLEHVPDPESLVKTCINLLKPGGLLFLSTINKNPRSWITAIVGAEYVLRWLPIGTHEWEKFVKPEELKKILTKNNLSLKKFDGMHFNIIKDEWSITKDLSVNYIAKFLKN